MNNNVGVSYIFSTAATRTVSQFALRNVPGWPFSSMHFPCIIVPFARYLPQVKEIANSLNNLQRGLHIINCKIKCHQYYLL